MRGHKLENGHSNVSNVEIEKSRVTGIANGKENTSSNIGAFDASKLQKLRNKGSKKTDTVVSKGSKPDPKKKTTKKNRFWDDSPPESKLDFTDPAGGNGNEEVDKHNKPDAKKTGWFSSMFHSIAGKANLDKADLEPTLKSLKDRLMTKNVAEKIVEKLCESVAASLEGKKLASLTMISSIVQTHIHTLKLPPTATKQPYDPSCYRRKLGSSPSPLVLLGSPPSQAWFATVATRSLGFTTVATLQLLYSSSSAVVV
ncbi:SRP54 domain-containing protein [Citrus sinensis]|nr:SRP54 domain-containing protein [Citrus sinensis]